MPFCPSYYILWFKRVFTHPLRPPDPPPTVPIGLAGLFRVCREPPGMTAEARGIDPTRLEAEITISGIAFPLLIYTHFHCRDMEPSSSEGSSSIDAAGPPPLALLCFELVCGAEAEQLAALTKLASLSAAEDVNIAELCGVVRSTPNCLERLCELVVDEFAPAQQAGSGPSALNARSGHTLVGPRADGNIFTLSAQRAATPPRLTPL